MHMQCDMKFTEKSLLHLTTKNQTGKKAEAYIYA